jgi:hypothetical protein
MLGSRRGASKCIDGCSDCVGRPGNRVVCSAGCFSNTPFRSSYTFFLDSLSLCVNPEGPVNQLSEDFSWWSPWLVVVFIFDNCAKLSLTGSMDKHNEVRSRIILSLQDECARRLREVKVFGNRHGFRRGRCTGRYADQGLAAGSLLSYLSPHSRIRERRSICSPISHLSTKADGTSPRWGVWLRRPGSRSCPNCAITELSRAPLLLGLGTSTNHWRACGVD